MNETSNHTPSPSTFGSLYPKQAETTTMTSCQLNDRYGYLKDRLDKISRAQSATEAEEPMHNFTCSLLQLKDVRRQETVVFKKGNETLLCQLEQIGAIPTLLYAIERFNGESTPEFNNSACIAIVHFAFQSKERSLQIFEIGGFQTIVQMMERYRTIDFIQIIAIAALMVVGKNAGIEKYDLEWTILVQIVVAMEYHQDSAQLYIVACSALGSLFGPGSKTMVPETDAGLELYYRAIDAICFGLVILHLDDRVAQNLGKNLLFCMVGQQVAEEIMFYVESSYGVYAAAAA
mmetsp:Transcript_26228/g.63911  ORF Transcript_26228/g.63911 Transcript_26228/m.63911 type:complete len:290 (-) Transcript_26228:71-940(-)